MVEVGGGLSYIFIFIREVCCIGELSVFLWSKYININFLMCFLCKF